MHPNGIAYMAPCEICGELFGVRQNSVNRGAPNRFCTRECWRAWVRRDLDTRACTICSKTFEVRRASSQRFCSYACHNRSMEIPPEDRLWDRFADEATERYPGIGVCRVWQGPINSRTGYGFIPCKRDGKRKNVDVHRLVYTLTKGPIPLGLSVLHRCDNRPCGRPDHLFSGTHADNMADAAQKGRTASGNRNGSRKYPERIPRGERRSHLRDADVIAMRTRYANGGVTQEQLAAEYKTTRRNVGFIIQRRSWTHV